MTIEVRLTANSLQAEAKIRDTIKDKNIINIKWDNKTDIIAGIPEWIYQQEDSFTDRVIYDFKSDGNPVKIDSLGKIPANFRELAVVIAKQYIENNKLNYWDMGVIED